MIDQVKPPRRILHLDANQMTVWLHQTSMPQLEVTFALDEAGQAEFRGHIERHRNNLFYLLADVVEEDFRQEELPFVRGADREALLTRKLGQYFFGTPFAFARSLGRNKDGRRDERFVLVGLTRAQTFEPWLQILEEVGATLVGVYASSQLMAALAGDVAKDEQRFFLLTLGSSGLRHSYFEAGELRFSRLTPLAASRLSDAATAVAAEAGKIHQYLIGQRLISRGQQIKTYCLTDAEDFERLREQCEDTADITFHRIDNQAPSRALAAETTDTHLIRQLGAHPPQQQFLPAKLRGNYRLWQMKLGLTIAAAASLAGCLLFSAWIAVGAFIDGQAEAESRQASSAEQARYNALLASLPPVETNPEDLRSLAEAGRALREQMPALTPALQAISHALDATPQLNLTQLNWRLASKPDDAPSSNNATQQVSGNMNLVVVDLEAQLPTALNQDKRAQSELIEQFAEKLRLEPQANTRILSRPFDTDSSKSLKAAPEAKSGTEALRFSLRYWRPITP